jgi:hypothetical protein
VAVAEFHSALQGREQAEEHQAHRDRDHAAEALQQFFVGQQRWPTAVRWKRRETG